MDRPLPGQQAPPSLPLPCSRLRSLDLSRGAAVMWAEQEFSHARLGDVRRTQRVVRLAARAPGIPRGVPTEASAAHEEGRAAAYDLLETPAVHPDDLAWAQQCATAQRCAGSPFVFVPVDGSSLHFSDPDGHKGLGFIG